MIPQIQPRTTTALKESISTFSLFDFNLFWAFRPGKQTPLPSPYPRPRKGELDGRIGSGKSFVQMDPLNFQVSRLLQPYSRLQTPDSPLSIALPSNYLNGLHRRIFITLCVCVCVCACVMDNKRSTLGEL